MKALSPPKINYPKVHTCKVCGLTLSNYNYTAHMRKHNMTKEEYFRKYMPVLFKNTIRVGPYIIDKQKFRNEWNMIRSKIRENLQNPSWTQLKFILYTFAFDGTIKGNAKYYQDVFDFWFKEYSFKECLERWVKLKNFKGVKSENVEYYTLRFGETEGMRKLQEKSERVKGDKNPGYNHGGKFSPLSNKFIHKDKVDKKEVIKKISKSNKENGNNSTTLAYWLNLGYDEETARQKLTERQTTFSLDICIKKYGELEGRKRHAERQKKWMKNFKTINFSSISQELFWSIAKKLDSLDNIYFAELNKDKKPDKSGKNHEYRLNLKESYIMPDFIDIEKRKIIEFDGIYWHGETFIKNTNKTREYTRDKRIEECGYEVLHIKEDFYRNNKDEAIRQCIEFLSE